MTRIETPSADLSTIADALLSAPGWAKVGLTAPTEHMREQAARELARAVLEEGKNPQGVSDQLTLRL